MLPDVKNSIRTLAAQVLSYDFPNNRQPLPALFCSAGDNHVKHFPVEYFHAAKIEDTILPESFQRIAECFGFTLCRRIGGIENKSGLCLQKTGRNAFAVITFQKFICNTRTNDPVHPSL